jgi:hypothetical protein
VGYGPNNGVGKGVGSTKKNVLKMIGRVSTEKGFPCAIAL